MKHHLTKQIAIYLLFLFLSSCATTPFLYNHPQVIAPSITELKIAIFIPKDEREPDSEIDRMWSNNPIDETATIIHQEIKSCGLFQEVILLAKPDQEKAILERSDIRMVLQTTVKDLSWEIPNRQAQEAKMLGISILTGGIGGLIYGSGSTDFYGKARVGVVLEDREIASIVLDKEYVSRAEDRMARLKTDSYEERARIIGKAFKQVMEQLKADLQSVVKRTLDKKQ